ncbi:MAG: organic solvent resistance ABC transporter ATP-binding protein [Verrucomicrobia bacterium]|nr:MAG: organic solvent resistance ABC transporter ATP-binding protein [Verrucomicrobiota bacterium]
MKEQQDLAIFLEHVTKSFGEKHVLRDVSLPICKGEAVCLLGRSGTGKSVTLKLMISLLKPDQGHVWIGKEDISRLERDDLSRVRRRIGFLFQSGALFDSLNLHDNLALPMIRMTDKSKPEIEETVHQVLSEVGLANDGQTMPADLSGGMRKRAGLARALALEPEILLVDEPSSGLDAITASEIDELLLHRKIQERTTLVIVTHDPHGARRIGDRFAVLEQGSLIAFGTAQELEEHRNQVVRNLMAEC